MTRSVFSLKNTLLLQLDIINLNAPIVELYNIKKVL